MFQFVGVLLFLTSMFVCCGSSLLSKGIAERQDLMAVGWDVTLPGGAHFYSAQRAITVSLMLSVFFGIAFAGIGLGLQAESRQAPAGALLVSGLGTAFWLTHAVFFAATLGSVLIATGAGAMALLFAVLFGLAATSVREMRRNPPPPGHEILPPDYKVPYSHLHQDPPEVRIARDLEQRRERLAVQQKELEMLEARLKRKLEGHAPPSSDPPIPPATERPS